MKRFAAGLAAAWLLAACSATPNLRLYQPPLAAQFANAEASAQEPVAQFWRGFHDLDLDQLVDAALVVLVGLACKNAILIVEFAKDLEAQGRDTLSATIEAARLRLRPILMTSIAFCAGVTPLIVSSGAGSEMRRAMGIAVFSGMLGVTAFGIFLTPVFYMLLRGSTARRRAHAAEVRAAVDAAAHPYHPGVDPEPAPKPDKP
jgi:multidrug efflux pump